MKYAYRLKELRNQKEDSQGSLVEFIEMDIKQLSH
jgi:hypothetical protein